MFLSQVLQLSKLILVIETRDLTFLKNYTSIKKIKSITNLYFVVLTLRVNVPNPYMTRVELGLVQDSGRKKTYKCCLMGLCGYINLIGPLMQPDGILRSHRPKSVHSWAACDFSAAQLPHNLILRILDNNVVICHEPSAFVFSL